MAALLALHSDVDVPIKNGTPLWGDADGFHDGYLIYTYNLWHEEAKSDEAYTSIRLEQLMPLLAWHITNKQNM